MGTTSDEQTAVAGPETTFATELYAADIADRDLGRTAARRVRDAVDADTADLYQAFVSAERDIPEVTAGIRDAIDDDAVLIGMSSMGAEFDAPETVDDGIAIGAVQSDVVSFATSVATGLRDDPTGTVQEAVSGLPRSRTNRHRTVISLHDGFAGASDEVVTKAQQWLGPQVSLVGGAAAVPFEMYQNGETPALIEGERVTDDAVVLCQVDSEYPIPTAVAHGHEPLSEPMRVTRSEGERIHELDGEPAFEVWKDIVRDHAAERFDADVDSLDIDSKMMGRVLAQYQIGIDQGEGFAMRAPVLTETTDGPLQFNVDIPEGVVVRIMRTDAEAQITAAGRAMNDALSVADRAPEIDADSIAGAFVYDCACRDYILADRFDESVQAIDEALDAPAIGVETVGEVCVKMGSPSGYHNTNTVAMLIPG